MLLIVRHGETLSNRQGLLLGIAEVALTERGGEQARQLATRLPVPDRVVSSPLRRARDTAAAFGRPVEIDERWIELDYGELDGQPPAAVPDGHVGALASRRIVRAAGRRVVGDAGEPGVARRVPTLSRPPPTSTVVVVTHVSPIKAAIAWALDVPIGIAWRMYVEDASVSRIDIEPARTGRALVQSWRRCKSTERTEERVGGVVPRGKRLHRVAARPLTQRLAPFVVGGQPPQGGAQAGDVAGLDETSLSPVLDEVGQVARSPPDRREPGGQRLAEDRSVRLGVAGEHEHVGTAVERGRPRRG